MIDELHLRHTCFQRAVKIIQIFFQIGKQRLIPVLSVLIGGLRRAKPEGVAVCNMQSDALIILKLLAQLVVCNCNMRHLKPRQVKGLTRRHGDDAVMQRPVGQLRKDRMRMLLVNDITVNFIRKHKKLVLPANVMHAHQLFFCPHASRRIVGAAKNEEFCLRRFLRQILKVHGELAIFIAQLVVNHLTPERFNGAAEREVYRRLNENAVALFGEGQNCCGKRRQNARRMPDPSRVDVPVVPLFFPCAECFIIALRENIVSVDRVLRAALDRLCHRLRHRKIHVGNP